jgi:hypothetical protein
MDASRDLNLRARAYLHSNCSHCHMKWGGGNADFQLLATLDLKDAGIVNVKPAHGSFDIKDARILAPGDPDRSILLYRMNKLGLGRMPHIASGIVDEPAVRLMRHWIKQLPAGGSTNGLDMTLLWPQKMRFISFQGKALCEMNPGDFTASRMKTGVVSGKFISPKKPL